MPAALARLGGCDGMVCQQRGQQRDVSGVVASGVVGVVQQAFDQPEVPPGGVDHAQLTAQELEIAKDHGGCLVVLFPALEHARCDAAALGSLFEVEAKVSPAQILEGFVLSMLR
ncbi:MAG: hypothetical protein ABR558_11715, partial [Thioalkalivibrio sp.]